MSRELEPGEIFRERAHKVLQNRNRYVFSETDAAQGVCTVMNAGPVATHSDVERQFVHFGADRWRKRDRTRQQGKPRAFEQALDKKPIPQEGSRWQGWVPVAAGECKPQSFRQRRLHKPFGLIIQPQKLLHLGLEFQVAVAGLFDICRAFGCWAS